MASQLPFTNKEKKRIGLLGGTFDPIHFGHLNLAIELKEKRELDAVWFIPALQNPHKESSPLTSIEHRVRMIQLAIEGIPEFALKDVEKKRPIPSYTIDTIREFIDYAAHHALDHQYFLMMGEDAIASFSTWHLSEEILSLVPLLVGSRTGIWQCSFVDYTLPLREAVQQGLTPTRLMDISSRELRQRIRSNLYSGHLLPASVMNYITLHQLYSE